MPDPFTVGAVSVSFVVLTTATTAMATFEKMKYEKAKNKALAAKHINYEPDGNGTIIPVLTKSKSFDYSNERFNKFLLKKSNEEAKNALKAAKKLKREADKLKKELEQSKEDALSLKNELEASKEQTKELKEKVKVTKEEIKKVKKALDGSKPTKLDSDYEDLPGENSNIILVNKSGITSSKFSPTIFRKTNKEKFKIETKQKLKIDLRNNGEDSEATGALSDLSEFGDLNNFDPRLLIGHVSEIPNPI